LKSLEKGADKDIDLLFRDVKKLMPRDQVSWTNNSLEKEFSLSLMVFKSGGEMKRETSSGESQKEAVVRVAEGRGVGNGMLSGLAGGGASELGNYHQMIHDRFYSRWEQPTSIVRSNQDFIAVLKIRIRKDGTIILREISTPSGNPIMDESVINAAQKIAQIAPLPNGLPGETYDVKIQFKLDRS
jgi:TonB family protein